MRPANLHTSGVHRARRHHRWLGLAAALHRECGRDVFMVPWINHPDEERQAGLREGFPKGKIFSVALVLKPGNHPR